MVREIRLGTSSFTADGWNGSFYPKGMKSADYLAYYSRRFDTVEVDSTFYRCPTIEAVRNWALKTLPGFIFSLNVPRTITHEKMLVDCDKEFEQFVTMVHVLGEKLGPMVLQFPFFNEEVFTTPVQFESRLKAFFKKLSLVHDYRFAVEIRNKYWPKPRPLDVLPENNVALVLQDQSWMPRPKDLENYDLITTDFSYIRWLGNRKDIEKLTTTWNSTIIDRTADLQTWVDVCEKIQKRGITQYVYAKQSLLRIRDGDGRTVSVVMQGEGIETPLNVEVPAAIEPTLFDISPN
jgi:uncharacterized protein YecE (DUF72 family)